MTLRERHEREIKEMVNDAAVIRKASAYTNSYLKWGNNCDSSDRAAHRMEYVKAAEAKFIVRHRKEILEEAALMVESDIG